MERGGVQPVPEGGAMAYCPHCEERYYEESCPICVHPIDCGCDEDDDEDEEDTE